MHRRPSDEPQGPLPSKHENAKDQVDDLKDRERLHCEVQIFRQEIPEYFGPEEAFYGGCYLVYQVLDDMPENIDEDKTYRLQQ